MTRRRRRFLFSEIGFAGDRWLSGRSSYGVCGVASPIATTWAEISDGIPASLPAPYPAKQSIMANLVASVGMRQGWGVDFVRAAYRRWLQLGHETGSEPNLSESLRDIGVEPQPVLALAKTADAKAALMAETAIARDLGIFGSPTFVVGHELFWGDDRLEDAISWYRHGCVRSLADTSDALTLHDIPEPDSLGG